MPLSNTLIGGRPLVVEQTTAVEQPIASRIAPDGTEWAVATLVIAALGVLILFRIAGFQAVIAASVGK